MPGQQVRDSRYVFWAILPVSVRDVGRESSLFLAGVLGRKRRTGLRLRRGGLPFPSQTRRCRALFASRSGPFVGAPLPERSLPESNITVLYFSPRWLCGAPASGIPSH